MRFPISFLMVVVSGPMLLCSVHADEAEDASKRSLEVMTRHVGSLRATLRPAAEKETPLKLIPKPILRYSDPGGITTDASIWAWGDKGRPAALAGIFFLNREAKDPKWSCELLSLADNGVTVRSQADWSWSPPSGGLQWFPLKGSPGDSDRLRLRQMKQFAEQHEVVTIEGEQKSQLRLMVQPLHRYADADRGLIDGAIFSYAAGTNPEALLLVECRKGEKGSAWHGAFARFGANILEARSESKLVWECPSVKSWHPKEAYFSAFGPAEKVFGAE